MTTMQLINYFEYIYAVNLPERTDRRSYIENELTKLNNDNTKNKLIIFPGLQFQEKGEFPNSGVRGCVMSHFTILNIAQKENFKNILILQDDCCISKLFWQKEEEIMNELANTTWDIAYLGHGADILKQSKSYFIAADPQQTILLTHFCAFNNRVLPRLLDFMTQVMQRPANHPEGGPMYLDGFMNVFRYQNPDVVTLLATPSLGWQRCSRSNLTPTWFDRYPVLYPVAEKLRTLKNYSKRGKDQEIIERQKTFPEESQPITESW